MANEFPLKSNNKAARAEVESMMVSLKRTEESRRLLYVVAVPRMPEDLNGKQWLVSEQLVLHENNALIYIFTLYEFI